MEGMGRTGEWGEDDRLTEDIGLGLKGCMEVDVGM